MEPLKLRNPIKINNVEKSELNYDFNEISCDEFALASSYADAKSLEATRSGKPNASVMEQNSSLHMYLGMMAILAVNSDIDITDLERIKGYDIIQITQLGRNFTAGRLEEPSSPSNSEEQSEASPESTTQELEK